MKLVQKRQTFEAEKIEYIDLALLLCSLQLPNRIMSICSERSKISYFSPLPSP